MLVVPVINFTHPLVIFRKENPYLSILHAPRAGAVFTGERAPPPPTDDRTARETPQPRQKRARRTSPKPEDDEVHVTYSGPRATGHGTKQDPIDIDTSVSSSSSKGKKRAWSDVDKSTPSNVSQKVETEWNTSYAVSVLPAGPFRGARQLLSVEQVADGKCIGTHSNILNLLFPILRRSRACFPAQRTLCSPLLFWFVLLEHFKV